MRSAVIKGRLVKPSIWDNPWAGYRQSSACDPTAYACALELPEGARRTKRPFSVYKTVALLSILAFVFLVSGCGEYDQERADAFESDRRFMHACWDSGGEPILTGPNRVCVARQPMK